MKIFKKYFFFLITAGYVLSLLSCKKDTATTNAAIFSEFINASQTGKYLISDDTSSVFEIPIGLTAACEKPMTINFTVASPSGALQGQQYSLGATSITIPANTLVDSIPLKGIFSGYTSGRKDTLIFTITGGDIGGRKDYTTYTVVLRQYCHSNIYDFIGDYTNCTDKNNSISAPYSVSVDSVLSTGTTSATLYIRNLASASFGPYVRSDAAISPGIAVSFDWSDSSNLVTTIAAQKLCDSVLTYGQGTISGVTTGSYSSCDNSITLNYTVTVAAGTFGDFVTTLRR
ncbi:MAG TPA: hypothetical protein VG847_05765 [Chitinophagaceae bacterium]|nr:hypothetical protein [Chitinophagaceae bacterium]